VSAVRLVASFSQAVREEVRFWAARMSAVAELSSAAADCRFSVLVDAVALA
jgi:hypothetical protein